MALSLREVMEATPGSLDKDEFIKRLHEKMTGFESDLEEQCEKDKDEGDEREKERQYKK